MQQVNFKKLTLVLALSSVFDITAASATLVSTPAIKDVPQGTSSVDVVLTGTSNKANQWTGSINGASVDNSFIFGQGFRPTADGKPVALDNISVKIKDFTDGMDLMAGVNIGDIKDNGHLALTVSNSTINKLVADGKSYNAYLARVSAERDLQLSATLNVEKVNIDKSHWVYGFYDNAKDAKRTYTQVRQNVDELTGGNFIANLVGGGNGFAKIENLDVNMSKLDLVNVYGLANTRGGIAQVGNYAINVKDSKLQSLYGLALQAGSGQFTLAGDYRFNVEKVTADRINALAINAPSFVADGDIYFSLKDATITGAGGDGRFSTVSFAPKGEGKKYVFNGNVITEINNSSSAYGGFQK